MNRSAALTCTNTGLIWQHIADVFDFPMVTDEDDREAYGEQRLVSLGFHQGRIVVMVWTERDSGAHLISCRYADKTQILRYRHEISGH